MMQAMLIFTFTSTNIPFFNKVGFKNEHLVRERHPLFQYIFKILFSVKFRGFNYILRVLLQDL